MNHWLIEELTWLSYAEKQRMLDDLYMLADVEKSKVSQNWIERSALLLSAWLIAAGEYIRQRYEHLDPIASRTITKKLAR